MFPNQRRHWLKTNRNSTNVSSFWLLCSAHSSGYTVNKSGAVPPHQVETISFWWELTTR